MYTLWIRNTNDSTFEDMCIYNDESTLEEFKIESASLSLEEGSAGSLSLRLPVSNDGYEFFELFATEITVKKQGAVYWMGRLLNSSEDFYANLGLTFEGTYNYLMDTVVQQYHFVGQPSKWARLMLSYHNKDHASAGEFWKVIQPGVINFNDGSLNEDFYSDYETALDLINNVCEGWKGHPSFRYEQRSYVDCITIVDGVETTERINYDKPYWNLILDISYEYDTSGNLPTITFGENLEDYTKENNVDELCTVIIPKGKAYDDTETATVVASFGPGQTPLEYQLPIEGLDYYRTIYRLDGTIYLVTTDTDMLSRFGLVCKVIEFSDCTDFNQLKSLGQHYLAEQKWIGTTITIKAIDATLLGIEDVTEIKIGKGVKCYSAPHGLDHTYPCTAIEEDLLNPANTTFTLGIKDDKYMSDSSRQADNDLKELIIESRKKENLIKKNTHEAIKNSFKDPTIWTNSELMAAVDEKVRVGVSTAESVATGDAKKNALTLLNIYDSDDNPNNKGYVHFKKTNQDHYSQTDTDDHIYEICISDTFDYTTGNVWRWNKTGLYFIERGTYNQNKDSYINDPEHNPSGYQNETGTLRIGITADGSIVADRISVGKLDAGIIRAGYLTSQDYLVEYGGSGNIQDANFLLDINNGIMTAKTGTLIFNKSTELDGWQGTEHAGHSSFVYLSNLTTGELATSLGEPTKGWMYVSGQASRDWMMIIGSNFGVDKYGRAFMREGVIGATGGLWNLMFFNDISVNIQWVQRSENLAELQYRVSINTTGARPVGAQVKAADIYDTAKEQLICRWRLAKYNSNHQLEFFSPLFNLSPPAGNDSYQYEWKYFSTPITYAGTTDQAREYYNDIYYKGVFFPVYYSLDDVTENPDYTQDNHNFILVSNRTGGDIQITGGTASKPEYTCYSNSRYVPGIMDNYDSVRIGSGYLYCGDIGTDSSFSLNAINRTATVANVLRDDWRFTVGSRCGVTSNGTLYCYGAILNNVTASGTVAARTLDSDIVGGVRINSEHAISGTVYQFNIQLRLSYGYGNDDLYMYLSSAGYDDGEGHHSIMPQPDSSVTGKIPQDQFYDDIKLKITITSHFQVAGQATTDTKVRSYEVTYYKNQTTTWTDAGSQPQYVHLATGVDWKEPPYSGLIFTHLTGVIEMMNERSGEDVRPTWTMSSSNISTAGYDATSTTGQFTVQKIAADNTRPCTDFGSRDILTNGYLGGPISSDYISHAYISTIHYSNLDQTSSRLYKTDIRNLPDIYDRVFDDLRPVSYMYKNDERKVYHTGFIMEEVGDILTKNGVTPMQFGAYNPNENGIGGALNYIDFIALNTRQIQKLKERIRELEERLDEVERNENSSNT